MNGSTLSLRSGIAALCSRLVLLGTKAWLQMQLWTLRLECGILRIVIRGVIYPVSRSPLRHPGSVNAGQSRGAL
jgi:hypothetical protein